MSEVRWIKITTDIFSDEKILLIEQMPDADSLLVIWFKLLCMAGKENNYGVFMMRNRMPYTEEMLATIFRRPLNTVRLALSTFEAFGMIEIDDEIITIPNWEKHQNIEGMEKIREQTRLRVAKHREKQKQALLVENNVTDSDNTSVTVTLRNATDKNRIDKNRLEEDKSILSAFAEPESPTPKKTKPVKHKYGEYGNVLLTDDELQKLKAEYSDYLDRIERLSSYVASTGKSYKSHYATIRNWARKDQEQKKGRKELTPKWMAKEQQQYDFDALENELLANGTKTTGTDPELKARADALKKMLGGDDTV